MQYILITLFVLIAIALAIGFGVGFALPKNATPLPTITPTTTPTPTIPTTQQSPPLVPSDIQGNALFGESVGITADGTSIVAGGYHDNSNIGATWIYVQSGTNWNQQGLKLIGSGATGNANQGRSVAISRLEQNTVIVGGPNDNGNTGGTWIFVRSNNTWSQQGSKLVGSGISGINANQGSSVAISDDGNTALTGGTHDASNVGAVWVFVRANQTWSQQGTKLVGTDNSGASSSQGYSTAISADGNTVLSGGVSDSTGLGATWVFVRSIGIWNQQGLKLVGTGYSGSSQQGTSTALSVDGNTALIGGPGDNNAQGACWVFVRTNQSWTQQGNKLTVTDGSGFGVSASLNATGNIAVIGAYTSNSNNGQFYVFVRSNNVWSQSGSARVATGLTLGAELGWSIAISENTSTTVVGAVQNNTGVGSIVVFD